MIENCNSYDKNLTFPLGRMKSQESDNRLQFSQFDFIPPNYIIKGDRGEKDWKTFQIKKLAAFEELLIDLKFEESAKCRVLDLLRMNKQINFFVIPLLAKNGISR